MIYPAAVWGISRIKPDSAEGNLIYQGDCLAGSTQLQDGQTEGPYFFPRSEGMSNYGASSSELEKAVQQRRGDIAKRDVFNAPAKVQRTSAQLDVLVDVQAFYAALRLCLHISFTFLLCGQAPSHKRADIPAQHYVITYWYHTPVSMMSLSLFYVRFSRTIDCDAQLRLGIAPPQPLDYIDL